MDTSTPSSDASGGGRRKRLAHQKSRNGCIRCKSRHRKCDEVHPQCGTCRQSGSTCSFEAAASTDARNASGEHCLAVNDMRLLYHWLKGDGVFFEDHDSDKAKSDRNHQMELAFAHPYLLHSMLSIAALDLFHHEPTTTLYYEQAMSHHLAALRYGRPNITQSSKEHSKSLWCFSAFMSLYSFAEPPLRTLIPQHRSSFDCVRDLLAAFSMGRGIVSVMASNATHLGPLQESNQQKWPDETDEVLPTLDVDFPQRQDLARLVEMHCDAGHRDGIDRAVTELFAIISLLQQRPKQHSSARLIQTWAMHADEALHRMWEERHPLGLVILAHYALLVNMRANIWFFERWPLLIMDAIEAELDQSWQQHIVWPRDVIRSSVPVSE